MRAVVDKRNRQMLGVGRTWVVLLFDLMEVQNTEISPSSILQTYLGI